MHATEVSEFYYQLSLLLKAGLPLPESLEQLVQGVSRPRFKKCIGALAKETSEGHPLSAAMEQFPKTFTDFQRQLVKSGEEGSCLPEVLMNISRYARFDQLLAQKFRDIFAYPIFTIFFGVLLFGAMLYFVVPGFEMVIRDIIGGYGRLPPVTRWVFSASHIFSASWMVILPLLVVAGLGAIWLMCGGRAAQRALVRVVYVLPGAHRIARAMEAARLSSLMGLMLKQGMPIVETLRFGAQLTRTTRMQRSLTLASAAVGEGRPLYDALAEHRVIDGLISLTVKHTPEAHLSDELIRLSNVFHHRATLASKTSFVYWSLMAIFCAAVVVGIIVIALFMPMISFSTFLY